ncbi:hypothetical protein VTN31DRAFT_2467 [Thermomyces dupontii]|uniref:uncharacterized protein n=1 Tax=Talaromyces thermophilus TaxID=28565 RepID=UPI003743D946
MTATSARINSSLCSLPVWLANETNADPESKPGRTPDPQAQRGQVWPPRPKSLRLSHSSANRSELRVG